MSERKTFRSELNLAVVPLPTLRQGAPLKKALNVAIAPCRQTSGDT